MNGGKNVIHQLGLGIDQLANVFLGGYADETLSARCYRLGKFARAGGVPDRWSRGEALVNWLFSYQDRAIERSTGKPPTQRHCERAYHAERDRRHLPPEYRD